MKKMRKRGSFISMENLLANDDDDENADDSDSESAEERKYSNGKKGTATNDTTNSKIDTESVVLHPVFILEKGFSRV